MVISELCSNVIEQRCWGTGVWLKDRGRREGIQDAELVLRCVPNMYYEYIGDILHPWFCINHVG